MKATGIVRRIDDLGRVVVPKEIRRTLHIREGDPLEIFTDREGEIILKKYSLLGELGGFAKQYAEALAATSGHIVCITDRDQHIAVSGQGRKEFFGKPLGRDLERLIHQRNTVCCPRGDKTFVELTPEADGTIAYETICPIISGGDAIGAVIIATRDEKYKMNEVEKKASGGCGSFSRTSDGAVEAALGENKKLNGFGRFSFLQRKSAF